MGATFMTGAADGPVLSLPAKDYVDDLMSSETF